MVAADFDIWRGREVWLGIHTLAITVVLLARSVPPMEGEIVRPELVVWPELALALLHVADEYGGLIPGGVCAHMVSSERAMLGFFWSI